MTQRTTQAELTAVFEQLMATAARSGVDVRGWALSRWAPGDGMARYRIESDGGSRTPLGERHRTASEMASAMRLAFEMFDRVPDELRTREHVEHVGSHGPNCCVCPKGVRAHLTICPAGAMLRPSCGHLVCAGRATCCYAGVPVPDDSADVERGVALRVKTRAAQDVARGDAVVCPRCDTWRDVLDFTLSARDKITFRLECDHKMRREMRARVAVLKSDARVGGTR